jgi:hypothetical protein
MMQQLTMFWEHNSEVFITGGLWSLVGLFILSPLYFLIAYYRARKLGSGYHYREPLHVWRRKYRRSMKLHGGITLMLVLAMTLFIIM